MRFLLDILWELATIPTVPLYEFRCKRCRAITTTLSNTDSPTCQLCEISMGRVYSFAQPRMFTAHFNSSVGAYVTSQADFNDKLRQLGHAQEERTGIPTRYVPIDAGDRQAFGISDEISADWEKERHDHPIRDPFLEQITND